MNARTLGLAVVALIVFAAAGLADRYCLFSRAVDGDFSVARLVSHEIGPDIRPVHLVSQPVRKETMIDKTFSVRPGELLEINNVHSDVVVETGGGSEARVRVTLSGRGMDRARAFYEHLNFQVDKSGRTLSVSTNPHGSWNGSSGGAEIDIVITIPEVFDADVTTRHGDVETGDLKGELRFDVAHGDLQTGTLSGNLLTISAAHGDVDTRRVASEKVRIDTQHGDLDVGDVTGMVVEFRTRHGDIDVDDVTADEVGVVTEHGDISIARLDGYPEISATHGDIDVRLANARGGAFRSHHGDIDLTATPSAGMNLDFEASEIEIAALYEYQGRQQRGRIEGAINGGGPKLAAKSTHGHIRLHATGS